MLSLCPFCLTISLSYEIPLAASKNLLIENNFSYILLLDNMTCHLSNRLSKNQVNIICGMISVVGQLSVTYFIVLL